MAFVIHQPPLRIIFVELVLVLEDFVGVEELFFIDQRRSIPVQLLDPSLSLHVMVHCQNKGPREGTIIKIHELFLAFFHDLP